MRTVKVIAAVLAGGDSKRIGVDKLFIKIHGIPLINYCLKNIEDSSLVDEIVIVTKSDKTRKFNHFKYRIVIDSLNIGPLGGLYKALIEIGDIILIGGDMPLIKPELIDVLIREFLSKKPNALVPRWRNGMIEPLLACYSKNIIKHLENAIKLKMFSMRRIVNLINTEYFTIDPLPMDLKLSFFNINTWKDIKILYQYLNKGMEHERH